METPTNLYTFEDSDIAEIEYFTLDEATQLAASEASRLAQAESGYNQAKERYARELSNLPSHDSDEGRALRAKLVSELEAPLIEAEQTALNVAETVHMNMSSVYSQTSHSQYSLTPDEHHLVESRRNIIKEDSANLAYGRLVGAVQYAILQDDRPAMFLYGKYVAERIAYGENNGTWSDAAAKQEKTELQRMLRSIDRKLKDDKIAPVNVKASEVLVRAGKLVRATSRRRLYSQKYPFQGSNEVSWDGE